MESSDTLLRPAQTAALLGITTKTLTRWSKTGKLQSVRTLGGHRRYRESTILAMLKEF